MATIDQLFSVQARQNEVWRRIKAGSLKVEDVLAATQGILDGDYPLKPASAMPSWYLSPEVQIEKVTTFLETLGDNDFRPEDIPTVPAGINGVLLLTVFLPDKGEKTGLQRTFDAWRQFATVFVMCRKPQWDALKSDPEHLRLAPGYEYRPGIRWVVFRPNVYEGKSSMRALELAEADGYQLAGLEVFMALSLFPG